jgi:hypothetical protein
VLLNEEAAYNANIYGIAYTKIVSRVTERSTNAIHGYPNNNFITVTRFEVLKAVLLKIQVF